LAEELQSDVKTYTEAASPDLLTLLQTFGAEFEQSRIAYLKIQAYINRLYQLKDKDFVDLNTGEIKREVEA
jgi:hypothetical protein